MPGSEDFHPDLRKVARWIPRSAVGPRSLGINRTLTRLLSRKPASGVTVRSVGSISVRLYGRQSSEDALPALLWIHGGGFILGSAAQDDAVCQYFARHLGIVVASVEYRLAPEFPFPIPLNDCYDALVWLSQQSNVDPTRIAVGGASAGGGLAAALALFARDQGDVQLALQVLLYPMLDDRTTTRTDIDESNFRLWNNKANRFGWQSYLGLLPDSSEISALAAPARNDDLSGLPPAWLGVGTLDLFYEEDAVYARRLKDAGVECELHVVEGAYHGFELVQSKAGVSREFRSRQVAALAAALAPLTDGDRPKDAT
jgi:acetyl esterase/lipase